MSDNPLSGKVGLDTTDFKTAISQMNRDLRVIESGFRANAASIGDWGKSADGLTMRMNALTDKIDIQKNKVSALQDEYKRVAKEKGENSRAAQELQIKLNRETEALNSSERELKDTSDALDKMGDESKQTGNQVDKMGDQVERAEKKTGSFKTVLSGLGGVAKTAVVGLAGLTGVVAGVVAAMATAVVKSFGELEQNLGGSEAVFGEYAASIQKSGEEAYKNLGVSQSDYLATANKMGALFQGSGLDQVKSLELTEKAMQRAADMASVMGIDTQVALDSVAGAAKGNFTMMDNLGVAMNATTVEAYALSKGLDFTWASATNAEKADVAMQMFFENTEQYAGNFAKESSETITGSIGMLKAAFGSLLGGLGNSEADVGNLAGNLVDAFKSVITNIVPVLGNIVTVLPEVVDTILVAIVDLLPILLETVTTLFSQVLTTVVNLLPSLIPIAIDAILIIVNALILNLPMLITAAIDIVMALVDGIISMLPMLIEAAIEIIFTLIYGLTDALPKLIAMVPEIVMTIVTTLINNLPMLIEAALELILALVNGLVEALPILIEMVPEIIVSIVTTLIDNLPMIITAAIDIIAALILGLVQAIPTLLLAVVDLIAQLIETFKNTDWKSIGDNIIAGIQEGFLAKWKDFKDGITEKFNELVGGIKGLLGIESPSTIFAGIGGNMALGLGGGFLDQLDQVQRQINSAVGGIEANIGVGGLAFAGQGASGNTYSTTANVYPGSVNNDIDMYRLARQVADEIRRAR
jgi:phage-related protein